MVTSWFWPSAAVYVQGKGKSGLAPRRHRVAAPSARIKALAASKVARLELACARSLHRV